jgi:uncharacterized protein with PQ loop repeat
MACYEALGLASGAVCGFSILPQIYKTYKTGSSEDLSTSTIVCTYMSLGLGTAYGFLIGHVAIYVSDLTLLGLYAVLHALKVRNDCMKKCALPEADLPGESKV